MSAMREGSQAIILLNTETGLEPEVYKEIKQIDHVAEAHIVYGLYDIFMRVEAEIPETVRETISKIRQVNHVRSTLTMVVSE